MSNKDYEELVEDHVKSWLNLYNSRKKGNKYKMDFKIERDSKNTFRASAYLDPSVVERPYPPGKGVHEGFFDHLIPPPPLPPPDKLE